MKWRHDSYGATAPAGSMRHHVVKARGGWWVVRRRYHLGESTTSKPAGYRTMYGAKMAAACKRGEDEDR